MQMTIAQTIGTLTLLGDESRLRLCALLRERELSVSEIVKVTGISQSRVSTHLAKLREGGFVRDRRDGAHAFYALATDGFSSAAAAVLDEATSGADPTLEGDKARLRALLSEQKGALPDAFAGEMERHYSPGRTWSSLALGLASLLELGDVLDVGAGDGAVAALVAPRCRSLTCVDTNDRMITAAKRRLARAKNVTVAAADAEALPFLPASFDAALVFHTLTYAARPQRVLDECARVLRPGGRLVLLSLDEHHMHEVTLPYGERHSGFSPRALRGMLTRSGLTTTSCEVVVREAKKPHFQVVLGTATKAESPPKRSKARHG